VFGLLIFALSPGFNYDPVPDTIISVPVKTVLSPGLAISTISPLKITSIDLGIVPAGITSEFS
jgi:hypothetical protein